MKTLSKSNIKTILRLIYCTRENIHVPYKFNDGYTNIRLPINRRSIEHVVPKCYLPRERVWDLNNMFLVDKDLNNVRSNTKFGRKSIQNVSFYPSNPESRGVVSRICAHMIYTCPNINPHKVIPRKLMFEWNEKYPVTDLEKYRNERIYIYQNTYNRFIEDPKDMFTTEYPFP